MKRDRTKLIVGLAVLLALIAGALTVWVVLREDPSGLKTSPSRPDIGVRADATAIAADLALDSGVDLSMIDARKKRRFSYRITDRDLRRRIRRYGGMIRVCYRLAARRGNKPVPRRVSVVVQVSAGGRVKQARVLGDLGAKLRRCLQRSLRGWRFPVHSRAQTLRFPILLAR